MTMFWFWARLSQITIRKDQLALTDPAGEIWTNLVLIRAKNEAEALRKATAIGRSEQGDCRGSLTLDGHPAITKFIGIENAGVVHDALEDGAEILFEMRRGRLSALRKRLSGTATLKSEMAREIAPYRRINADPDRKRAKRRRKGGKRGQRG